MTTLLAEPAALERVVGSAEVRALAAGADVAFAFAAPSGSLAMSIRDGAVAAASDPRFTLRAADDVWARLLAREPQAGGHSIVHLVRTGLVALEGDARAYSRHVHLVRGAIDALRGSSEAPVEPRRPLRARGEYVRVTTGAGSADLHVERCGTGPQLLALATAGSTIAQWHGLMTESDLTDRFEIVAVDLPWHGMSSPEFGVPAGDWRLTPGRYTELIVAAADALALESPTLVGASMAGAAVVHAIATHPERFRGAVACQAGERVRARSVDELRATDIDASRFVPEWTYGLMNPASPAEFTKRVWWGYSSGGSGMYAADIDSYQQWEFDDIAHLLGPDSPHIAVLSGVFDTSVPPDASRALAARIPNSSFREMPELGHFPHAENPAAFAVHLEEALGRVGVREGPRRGRRG